MSRTLEAQTIKGSQASVIIDVPDSLRILEDGEAKPHRFGMFSILTPKDGDKRIVWDSMDMRQIEEAKVMFDQMILEGLVPYRVGLNGTASSEIMDEFDAEAEEIVFLPVQLIAGG